MKKISTIFYLALLLAVNANAQINFNQVKVEDWIGAGANEAMFVVDFDSDPIGVDSTFAWGIRFESDSISGDEILSMIAEADENFTFTMLGIFLDNIQYFTNGQNYTNPNSGWFSIVESVDGQNWEWNSGVSDNIANNQWFGIVAMNDVSWEAEINVPLLTSIKENDSMLEVNIYPNPSSEALNVSLSSPSQIIMTNLYGQVVYEGFSKSEKINLQNMASGTYLITIIQQSKKTTQKVIVE